MRQRLLGFGCARCARFSFVNLMQEKEIHKVMFPSLLLSFFKHQICIFAFFLHLCIFLLMLKLIAFLNLLPSSKRKEVDTWKNEMKKLRINDNSKNTTKVRINEEKSKLNKEMERRIKIIIFFFKCWKNIF